MIELPIAAFVDNEGNRLEEFLKVGAMVPLVNNVGQMVPGKVVSVGEETVTLDLNSPMAGKTLHFTGRILTVREATDQELHDGLHGENVKTNGCAGCHRKGGCHGGNGGCHGEGEC
ncbi:MAG: peptidylprolyl isomerase, partial [Bacteroidales bacterium]|nr:peptidylprolyl isomerase [Bacteroidales bacterium]